MENDSQNINSPRKSTRNELQSPSKMQQNQSEIMNNNQISPDKDKKPEKTKAEAKIALQSDCDLSRKLLLDGQIQKSLELSFKTIVDHKEALGGENSIFLLPGYFVLAEAFIQEGKIKKAVEFLLAASWNFLKFQNKNEDKKNEAAKDTRGANDSMAKIDEDVSEEEYVYYKAWLHKTFSKLYNAENNVTKALDELKVAIYLDSKKYGAEDIRTSFNYYHMGTIFIKKRCLSEAEGFFGKVSEIWYKFLKNLHTENQNINKLNESLDELVIKEAFVILKLIEEYFRKNLAASNNMQFSYYSKNLYGLALLHGLIREDSLCSQYLEKVVEAYVGKFGEEHKKTKKTRERLNLYLQEQEAKNG